jgi:Arc/MetJ-type ribon-helix-helix transcriptional regulator
MRDQDAIEKLRVDIEAGWQQVEEGKVSEFDPEAVKRRGREKLATLRAAIREGLDSGPAEPFDMEAILAAARADLPEAIADLKREARASGLTDPEIDAELEAWRNERKSNPSKIP